MKKLSVLALTLFVTVCYAQAMPLTVKDERDKINTAHVFHILFSNKTDALNLLSTLRSINPEGQFRAFKQAAKTKSRDPGSASLGGDLDKIREGEMDKLFENAVFAQLAGNISEPIKTDFGWHLIYVKEFHLEPVFQICEKSLDDYSKNAPKSDWDALQFTKNVKSGENLHPSILTVLGEGWGHPMANQKGQLTYFRVVPIVVRPGVSTLIKHTEFQYAQLNTRPLACRRSGRDTYTVDCNLGAISVDEYSEYELRGGRGRVLVSYPKRNANPINVPTAGDGFKQIFALVCQPG